MCNRDSDDITLTVNKGFVMKTEILHFMTEKPHLLQSVTACKENILLHEISKMAVCFMSKIYGIFWHLCKTVCVVI